MVAADTERFNDFFETKEHAGVAWGLFRLLGDGAVAYADKPLPPFPGDITKRAGTGGTGLYGAVKHAVPIAELARRFTTLTGGETLKGKCPLHEENTASFVVWPSSDRWRCFGACARGGDVIELARALMDKTSEAAYRKDRRNNGV